MYKVWLHIEQINRSGDGRDVDEPVDLLQVDTLPEAREVVRHIAEAVVRREVLDHWKRNNIYPFTRRRK